MVVVEEYQSGILVLSLAKRKREDAMAEFIERRAQSTWAKVLAHTILFILEPHRNDGVFGYDDVVSGRWQRLLSAHDRQVGCQQTEGLKYDIMRHPVPAGMAWHPTIFYSDLSLTP